MKTRISLFLLRFEYTDEKRAEGCRNRDDVRRKPNTLAKAKLRRNEAHTETNNQVKRYVLQNFHPTARRNTPCISFHPSSLQARQHPRFSASRTSRRRLERHSLFQAQLRAPH